MLHRLSVGLLATAIFMVPLPAKAQYGSAEDLGEVMNISLKDVVNTTFADQCAFRLPMLVLGPLVGLLMQTRCYRSAIGFPMTNTLIRFASDVTWRFGVNGLDDGNVDNVLFNHSHPSDISEHDQQLRQLDSCLVGMLQPVVLPPLPLPPLKQ